AGPVEEEDRDLLVRRRADVDAAMDALRGLVPVDLPRCHLEAGELRAVTGLDRKPLTCEHDRDAMERVSVPVHRLTRLEPQPAHEHRVAPDELLLGHRRSLAASREPAVPGR